MSIWTTILNWWKPTPVVQPQSFAPIAGRITSYGYAGDSTPDTNSEHAIGAWANHLEEGLSLAISRDVEQQFRYFGVTPKSLVDVMLANGIVLTLLWDDRTAAEYAGKPLTGRFDLFSPSGPSRYTDCKVIGFRKAV